VGARVQIRSREFSSPQGCSELISFGVERGMLDAPPFTSLPRPGGTEKSRNRKLDDRKVRIFWKKLTSSRLSAEGQIALKLILVTAQRPGEVALAAREEFGLEQRIWSIPAERSKNGLSSGCTGSARIAWSSPVVHDR
jgi:integrase